MKIKRELIQLMVYVGVILTLLIIQLFGVYLFMYSDFVTLALSLSLFSLLPLISGYIFLNGYCPKTSVFLPLITQFLGVFILYIAANIFRGDDGYLGMFLFIYLPLAGIVLVIDYIFIVIYKSIEFRYLRRKK